MEGYVPNSSSPRLRPVLYPVTDAAGVGYGTPNMGWYGQYAMPVTSGGMVENTNFVYRVGGGASENSNVAYRVGYGIGESTTLVNQVGGGMGENPSFYGNRVGGGFVGSPTLDSRANVGDFASEDCVDDPVSTKRVKLLCSFGGKILRRPTDGELRYAGGQTRIISVRRDISFQELMQKMIDVYGRPVVIKYQLPDGELDALVSVSCSEDLENMMDEYEKLVESSSDGSAKLRVFLFSASEIDPSGLMQFRDLLCSGQRYIDAVNGIPDGAGGGITRQVSAGSSASTQNSDILLTGSESVATLSHGQVDGGGLSSPNVSSPKFGAAVSHDAPTGLVYVTSSSGFYAPSMPVGPSQVVTGHPQTLSSSHPQHEYMRPVPAIMQPHAPLGYDMHNPYGMEFRPATAYMQPYVDPNPQYSSQVGYMNPCGVGISGYYAGPPQQFLDNVVGIAHQQFIPTASMASLSAPVGMDTNVLQQVMQSPQTRVDPYYGENSFKARVAQFPTEQKGPVFQPQSSPHTSTGPLQGGGGCGLMPPAQHVLLSDGRVTHQPAIHPERILNLEDCLMCQRALPHAHSDTVIVVQDHRNCISSAASDPNLIIQTAQLDDNLGASPVDRVVLSGPPCEVEYPGAKTHLGVIRQIEHTVSEFDRPGFPQNLGGRADKNRILQNFPAPDNPVVLFSQGVIGKAVDVKPPHGGILHDIIQSDHGDALQQSLMPHLYQIEQETNPIGTLTPSSSEVSRSGNSSVESNRISQPVLLGVPGPYPQLNVGTQHMTSEELLHGKPVFSGTDSDYACYKPLSVVERKDVALGVQSRVVPNEAIVCPFVPSGGDVMSQCGGTFVDNWEHLPSKSLFSNQDPWALQHDSHFRPPIASKEPVNEESFIRMEEELHHKPSGHLKNDSDSGHLQSGKEESLQQKLKAVAEEVLHQSSGQLNMDPNSDYIEPNKDESIKQELKAVAEGVAAMVLQPSPEVNHNKDFDCGGVLQIAATVEDVKTKLPDKENTGLPFSDSIGRLQIIKNSDLEELRELGSGTFGTVYHGKWRGTDVAIKRFNDRCFAGKPSEQSRMVDDFWNEAIKLADLHHPNVVAFYGVVLDGPGDSVATVTEFMVNGSLRQALQRTLDKRKCIVIAMDVAFGMEYLHGKNIVHFDVKSDNLLVNLRDPHRPICKVGDLGLSKVKCHTLISGGVRGTLPWMAPELLNGSSSLVSEKVDVFSFGIVMWELLTGEEPYADLHYGVIIGGIVSNTLRPPIPESCDPEWRCLMERCWSAEPLERPNFKEIADQLRSMTASIPSKGQPQL